ncbi:MAG TPA: dihydrolipoyl dehydrogenase [Arenimonas sp.]|nr:dihydrolipoyl dehydrogenase [Arenimonas sp.]
MAAKTYDTIILGAGTAGLAALREVRKRTDDFLLVNDGPYGTTCARVGCMPSKVLIEAANAFHVRTKLGEFGVSGADGLAVDIPAVLARVRKLRDFYVSGVLKATEGLGERNLAGRGRLLGPDRVAVGDREFSARRIILATGSRPVLPAPWAALGERVITTDALFERSDLPRRIGVIGLGAIGVEMAQALARLGIEVTAFSSSERLAGLRDDKVNATLRAVLEQDLTLHTGSEVELEATSAGVRVRAGKTSVDVDAVLAAIGRRPNLDDIGLETLGVTLDDKGLPPFEPGLLRIGDTPVFIAGDVNTHAPILHEAADEGFIAGRNAMADEPTCYVRRTPLGIVFSDPVTAYVGKRRSDLPADTVVGEVDFSRQGRARAAQKNEGLLHVYATPDTGCILGAELCTPAGDHLAHLLALAVDQKLTVFDLLRMPIYHPVLEEGLRTALRDAGKHVDDSPDRSDLANCPAMGTEALD